MSYLLFMDESGHDHKQMPYEVRGGIAIRTVHVWPFAVEMRKLELETFGTHLHDYGSEIKGEKLLNKERFRWAEQLNRQTGEPYFFTSEVRRKLTIAFLERGRENAGRIKNGEEPLPSSRPEMTAFGQSCLLMVDGTLALLSKHHARLFATAIPRGAKKRGSGHDAD